MSVDSVRFNTPIATPVAAPVATPAPAAASKPSFSGEGAPSEEKKGGHTGMWLLGLAAVGVAGILIHKKIKAKDAENLIRTFKKDGATLEVLQKADKEGKITRSFVKKNDKGEVISTTVREYGEKGTKYKYAKQTVEDAKNAATDAAKPATEVAQEAVTAPVSQADKTIAAVKSATSKEASQTRVQDAIAKAELEIIESESRIDPHMHAAREKEISDAIAVRDQAITAEKKAEVLAKTSPEAVGASFKKYINSFGQPRDFERIQRNRADAKAVFSASTTTVKYGKTKAGHEYLLEKNADGKIESLIIGNNSPITSPNGIKKAIKKHKINLQG